MHAPDLSYGGIIDERHASSVINFEKQALTSFAGCGMMLCAGGRSGSAPSRGPRNIGVFPCIFESRVLDYLIVDVLSGSLKTQALFNTNVFCMLACDTHSTRMRCPCNWSTVTVCIPWITGGALRQGQTPVGDSV